MNLYNCIIEIIPGDKTSEVRKVCEASNEHEAWDYARKEAWHIAVSARVKEVRKTSK